MFGRDCIHRQCVLIRDINFAQQNWDKWLKTKEPAEKEEKECVFICLCVREIETACDC